MITTERDIDLVLVTGAGASREFGTGGVKLPLMTDWSDHLVQALASGWSHLEITQLRKGMTGLEFESQLGSFLRSVQAFRSVRQLVESSSTFPNLPQGFESQESVAQWYQQSSFQFDQIIEVIHRSLYEQFYDSAIDTQAAVRAFGQLFQALGISPGAPFVFATTNYDIIATRALAD